MTSPLHVLAVEPFYGGSHRAFLDGVIRHSRHRWTLVRGKPVHWKWRTRSAPLELANRACQTITAGDLPEVLFATEMLDLPTWRGMVRGAPWVDIPAVVYFHENQWTYPQSPQARIDFHFGYSNLLSALAADACWFNSAFHRDEFLAASEAFVRRMPDCQEAHDFDRLRQISDVFPPGFDPPESLTRAEPGNDQERGGPIRIGWVSRWEYDKRPDRLLEICAHLETMAVDYQLRLGGPRPKETPPALEQLRVQFGHRIAYDGFAQSSVEYWDLLRSLDVVVSTADHEFFGIAICEAIWAGAAPVLPHRLSYPELVSDDGLYRDTHHAATMIAKLRDDQHRSDVQERNLRGIERLQMKHTVKRLDDALVAVAKG